MTAPLTPPGQPSDRPPHQPPAYSPWSTPAGEEGNVPEYGEAGADSGDLRREVREAVVIAVVLTVLGVLLGVLWAWLAPKVPLISDGQNVYLKNTEGEEAIGADGTFVLLALAFGVLSTAAVFLFRRRGGIPLVVAVAVGGLLASLLGWQAGMWLGPAQEVGAHAAQVGAGVTFDAPLRLQAKGALLAWPVAAMLVQLALTGLFGPRDPEPAPVVPDWSGAPPTPSGPPQSPSGE